MDSPSPFQPVRVDVDFCHTDVLFSDDDDDESAETLLQTVNSLINISRLKFSDLNMSKILNSTMEKKLELHPLLNSTNTTENTSITSIPVHNPRLPQPIHPNPTQSKITNVLPYPSYLPTLLLYLRKDPHLLLQKHPVIAKMTLSKCVMIREMSSSQKSGSCQDIKHPNLRHWTQQR